MSGVGKNTDRKGTAASKTVSMLCFGERDEAPELPELSEELRLQLAKVAGVAREGLLAVSVAVGMRVMAEMMEDELTVKVGPKHAKIPGCSATRHASAPGSVVSWPSTIATASHLNSSVTLRLPFTAQPHRG